MKAKGNWKESLAFTRPSLSPDGRMIAITTADLPEDAVANEERALYLVDLSDPKRGVTRIPSPHSGSSANTKGE